MRGAKAKYTIETAEFDAPDSGGNKELGKFELRPTFKVSGKIILPEGGPFPEKQKLTIGRKYAWDHQIIDVAADGSFRIENLPAEPIEFGLPENWRKISRTGNKFQFTGNNKFTKVIDRDIEGMEIVLDPLVEPTRVTKAD